MASDAEFRKLNSLRVIDLRTELGKRNLDKTGVKNELIERLQKVITVNCFFFFVFFYILWVDLFIFLFIYLKFNTFI